MPAVGNTVPPVIVTSAHPVWPPPIAAAYCPPRAVTMPPEIVTAPDFAVVCPPPMPAAFAPPMAVMRPPEMLIFPLDVPCIPPPMPVAFFPPWTDNHPSPSMLMVRPEYTAMPGTADELDKVFVPFTVRSSVTPSASQIAHLPDRDSTSRVRFETVRDISHIKSTFTLPDPVTTCGPAFVITSETLFVSPFSNVVYQPGPTRCAMSSPFTLMSSGVKAVAAVCPPLTVAVQILSPSSYDAFAFSPHS